MNIQMRKDSRKKRTDTCYHSLFLPPISYLTILPMSWPMVFEVGSTPFAPSTCIILPLYYGVCVVLYLPYG